jgi:hypothetical protein
MQSQNNIMKTKQLLIGAIALMMALPMSAVQTTWYVRSDSGNDTSGDGSLAKPWKTFTTAYGKAAVLSGDILDVSGIFTTDFGRNLAKSITIQGNDKATAIFDGTAGNATLKNFANMTTNSINITIENVTFQNYTNYNTASATQGGVLSIQATTGCNVTLRNCNFLNNTGNLGAAVQIGSANNLTIEDCYFYNNYAKATTSGTISNGSGSGVYLSTGTNASVVSINRCLFESNTAQGSNGSAIAYSSSAVSGTAAASITITNSTFTGNSLTYSTAATPLIGEGVVNINANGTGVLATLINNTIAYNSSARTTSVGTPGLYVRGVANLTTLKNNILYSNFDSQTPTQVSTSIGSSVNLKESRNNITDMAYNWTTKTTNGATMASGNVSSIVNGSSVGQLGLAANAAALADNGGATKTLAIISVNSAAINAGYATGAPSVDQRIASRSTVDVGAYEYNATALYVPTAPTVNGATSTSLNITINENSNLSDVTYAIQETAGLKYVQADGTLGAAAVWQTAAVWGTKTVTGLTFNTSYSFRVKASRVSIESPFGAATTTVARAANMTFYVKPSGGSQWSGKLTGELQTDITATINLAVAGDQIWVASGTYTSPSGGFVMKDGVNVLGGFDGTEVVSTTRKPLTNKTILDGNFANKVLTQGAAGFTIRTKWDGFIIQNANTSAVNIGQNATIMNCVVRNNTTTGSGAGIQVGSLTGTAFDALTTDASNRAMIINCVIHNNTAANYGGGIFGGTGTKTFVANSSIVNNSITSASGQGAVSNGSGASFSFVNCILWGNMNNTSVTPTASQAPFGYATFSTSAYQGLSGVLVNLDAANSGSTVGVYYPQFTTPSTTIGSNASSLPSDISVSDWSLLSTSACLDKGLNTSVLYTFPTIDLVGNARAAGNYVDLGAIEYQKAISSSATTIAACTTIYGTASAARTITVSGANLTADIIATAPTGFEVSSNGSSYGATAAFTNSGGIASGTLSVRLAANAGSSGSYNAQDIVLSSTNCNAVNIVTAASGNIVIAKALTVTGATTANKVYDGTTTASVTGGSLVGVISPDVVDLVQAGDFDTKNVGTSKTITANCSISGAGAGNYTLSQPTLTARDITAISTPISTDSNLGNAATLPGTDVSVAAGKVLTVDYNTTVRSITVAPGAKLTLSNGLTATNGITLESDENGTATILQSGTLTGNVTAKQYLGSARNWYVSSPVSSAGAPATNVDYYYEYVEGGNNNDFATQPGSSSLYWKGIPNGTTMEVGKGYIAKTTAGTTVQFSGTPNNGDITTAFNLTRNDSKGKGFNLVGNPYPSYLDWVDVAAVNSNLDNSYYYRTKNSASGYTFVTWNGAGSNYVVSNGSLPVNTTVTRYIPPTQAFWVRVKSGTSSTAMNFTNTMREHRDDNGNLMKAKRQDTRTSVRLQLQNGTDTDELLIYQDEAASNNYDAFDSPKMMNNSSIVPDLYSKVGNERLVINGLNTITDNTEIPLGFSLNAAASLKLKATEMSNFTVGTRIYLLDKVESSQVELLPETEYAFKTTTATTNNESRFSLLFRAPGASTGIDNAEKGNTEVFVNAANQIAIIAPEKCNYAVYNALGLSISSGVTTANGSEANIPIYLGSKLQTGMYVVKLSVNGQSEIQKVIIR